MTPYPTFRKPRNVEHPANREDINTRQVDLAVVRNKTWWMPQVLMGG
jgi:hypothetical protein